ncbi:MAG: DUF3137 domain-containing protein [Bacilli bacterium]|nr:DUF3137 domain-containing protein [Bacilli bacterium]
MSLEELKALQDKVIKKSKTINIITFIICVAVVVITFIILSVNISLLTNYLYFMNLFITFLFEVFFVIAISLIIKNILLGKDIKIFNKYFKEIFVLTSLKKVFSDITYEYDKGLEESVIGNSELIGLGDRYSSNDYIKAKYKDINFEQADIHIEEEVEVEDRDGKKRTEWRTLFLGRWMIFDFNKKFKYNIHVYQGNFNIWWDKKYKKVTLEDEDFNKNFTVVAENEHDAFYILTPHFMEKIKEVVKNLNGDVSFGFVDNKLHVAINNYEDSFEHNIYKRINEEEIYNKIMKDIVIITKFVDELDLDNDLFKDGV